MSFVSRAGWVRLAVVLAALAALEAACRAGRIDPVAVIAPSQMLRGALRLLASGQYTAHILLTLTNVAIACGLAVIVGFGIGWLLYRMPRLRVAADPLLASYYAVPTFVFYPLFIVLFGLNRWPLVAIGFIFSFVAMAMSTLQGFERVPLALRRTARALRLSPLQEMVHVVLPSCAPYLFTGLKLSIAYSFIGVIAGEFVLSGAGFGFDIAFAYNSFDNSTMYGLMVLLLGFVGGLNMVLHTWERRMYLKRGGR
ncbi:MAG: ABC transporter permease subunit [Burkholderiales bacterium]|nr:ABC transporter permease subunit [Burkholderiales bacterium]